MDGGKTRPIPWKPLYVIGGLAILIIFVFSCGAVIFAISHSDSPEEPTPTPNPRNAEEYVFRGIDFADLGDFEAAIQDFTEALRLDSNFTRAYYNRGITYNKIGRYQDAIEDFGAAIDLNPNYGAAYANRAFAYTLLGLDAEAQADVDRAVELGENRESLEQSIRGARISR